MSRVFITQEPSFRVPGGWQSKFDLSPAKEFGELIIMMEPGNTTPDTAQECAKQMSFCMADNEFDENDYLLALGDPVLIAIAAMLAAAEGGMNLLRWDGRAGKYEVFNVRL